MMKYRWLREKKAKNEENANKTALNFLFTSIQMDKILKQQQILMWMFVKGKIYWKWKC